MTKVTGSIPIVGVVDGTTLMARVRVLNNPLVQYYSANGDVSPDFAAMAVGQRPLMYIEATDLTTGADVSETVVISAMYHNTLPVTFGTTFAKTTTTLTNGKTVQAVRVDGNLASPMSNPDNDQLSFDGTAVINGRQVTFKGAGAEFEVYESGGQPYVLDVFVPSGSEYDITAAGQTVKRQARLILDGTDVTTSTQGLTFEWSDVSADPNVPITGNTTGGQISGDNVTIQDSMVHSSLMLGCTAKTSGTRVATRRVQIFDASDGYIMQFRYTRQTAGSSPTTIATGIVGTNSPLQVFAGEQLKLEPVLKTTSGTEVSYTSAVFSLDDNTGAAVSTTGLTVAAKSITVTYEFLQQHDFALLVTAQITL